MRWIPLIILIICFPGVSSLMAQWKPLPNVKGEDAVINTRKAVIDTIIAKGRTSKAREFYNPAKLEFISVVIPDTLNNLEYQSFPLNWSRKEPIPNGMIFKDIASYNIKYLDKSHGLPGTGISSIAEDKDGLIYLTSNSGLLVWNGTEIKIYGDVPHFSFTNSKSLYYDRNGRMWIASDEHVGYIYENKLYLPKQQIFGGVHQQPFREDENGQFFISTNFNGLFIVQDDFILHYEKNLPHIMITDAILTDDGKLWIAFARHGVGYIENDSLFAYKEFGNYGTSRAFLEHDGELWIGNFSAPLMKFRNDSLFTMKLDVETNYVYAFEQNSKGVWFTDYSHGVFLIKPNGDYCLFNKNNGLINRNAFDLFIDSYDNVWVADLLTGISRIDENIFHLEQINSDFNRVNDVEIDQDGNTWYFRNGKMITKETFDHYILYRNESDSAFPIQAHCLTGFIREDGIWMGSYGQGIVNLDNMQYTFYQLKGADYFDNSFVHTEYDNTERIWAITASNQLQSLYDGQFQNFSETSEWKDFVFLTIHKTSSEDIFVTTRRNGVIQIAGDRYRKVELLESPNSHYVSKIYQNSADELWFFMNGEIQMMKADGSITRLENQVFLDNPVVDFMEVESDNYLGISSTGIVSIKKKRNELEIELFDRIDGLYMVDNSTISRNRAGELIIANTNGIIICDSVFLNKKSPPMLSLNRIAIDNDTLGINGDKPFFIEQGKQIQLVFNKIFWGKKSKLHYELKRNRDIGNSNQQKSNTLRFQELSYGRYELTVYATGGGQRSEEISINFEVLPYWYQTTWSKVLLMSLILGIVITYFLYRERQARVIKRQLEDLVQKKTSELASQLKQKEILMQEVHHRVKNNLTFLKSLLFLRSRATTSQEVKIILDECQSRIQTMALVHQNLYDEDNTAEINFSNFIKELFVELHTLFETSKEVEIGIDSREVFMDMKSSIFIGLILNELITNSFKYAFVTEENPKIFVSVSESEYWTYLEYWDNGIGLPEGFDITQTRGFGFKIINILVQQTDASIEYIGSKFLLTIPKN